MGLLRNRQKEKVSPLKEAVAGKISSVYIKIKKAWAEWMAARTKGLTKKDWIAVLACFVLVTGSYSTYLVASAFTDTSPTSIKLGSIRRPIHTGNTGEPMPKGRASDAEYLRIEAFRRYMDSLAHDPTGKTIHDSIIANRHGLMDSIRQVEEYYQQYRNR